MSAPARLLVRRRGEATVAPVLRQYDDWGLVSVDLAGPPRRLWADGEVAPVPIVDMGVDVNRVEPAASPADLLISGPAGEPWASLTRRSVARLRASRMAASSSSCSRSSALVSPMGFRASAASSSSDHMRLRSRSTYLCPSFIAPRFPPKATSSPRTVPDRRSSAASTRCAAATPARSLP